MTCTKVCTRCSKTKDTGEFYRHPKTKDGLGSWCKQCSGESARKSMQKDPQRKRGLDKQHRGVIRREMIAAYGGKCVCCGEDQPQFLTIDHTNKDGAEHRKRLRGTHIAEHLRKLGYPKDGFRLLCFNCNLALGFYGYCHNDFS